MCSELAVSVRKVSKAYKIFENPSQRLVHHLFGGGQGRDFWALNDISFEIRKGETFGIIGKNGSGKSTMLQLLAGILKPTSGEIFTNGKIAALLELGSGFNMESTGLENIYMNAAVLGVKRHEIEKKIQEIIEFADIGDFLNQPVKTYSSGMFVRLAFAVAINVEAEILLIDEALAVGDVFFRQKCYTKLNQLKSEGKTIILVSHGMGEVEQFCDRALLINKGQQMMIGKSKDVVRQYYLLDQEEEVSSGGKQMNLKQLEQIQVNWKPKQRIFFDLNNSMEVSNGRAKILAVGIFDAEGMPCYVFEQGEDAYFYYEFLLNEDIRVPITGTVLVNQKNIIVHGKSSAQTSIPTYDGIPAGTVLCMYHRIRMDLECGEYTFEPGLSDMDIEFYEQRGELSHEEFTHHERRLCHRSDAGSFSIVMRKHGNPTRLTHHGIANLDGEISFSFHSYTE